MLGQLAEEYGPDRVAAIALHVDYFNDPWKDPFSDRRFSRREMQYSRLYDREHKLKNPNYLYLTPLLMIDGRFPLLGTDDERTGSKARPKARAAIDRALAARPEVGLDAEFRPAEGAGAASRLTLEVTVRPLDAAAAGRKVLVEAVVTEDGLATRVGSGELKGKTYTGHATARSFAAEPLKLTRPAPAKVRFSLTLARGADPAHSRVVVFVQDEDSGRVYQAASISWPTGIGGR